MKTPTLFLLAFLVVQISYGQATEALYDLFPTLPSSVTNDDLRALPDKATRIPGEYNIPLRHRDITIKIYPIGKIETKKAVILFYADQSPAPTKHEVDLITVNSIAFRKKSGAEIPGSSMSYLTMSGDDAYYRKGDINFSGKEVVFRTQNFKEKGGDLKETTHEVYAVGKKGLEFVSKTTK